MLEGCRPDPLPSPSRDLKIRFRSYRGNTMGCRQYADSDLHLRNKTELESLPTRRRQQLRLPDNFVALITHGIILDMSYHRVFLYELTLKPPQSGTSSKYISNIISVSMSRVFIFVPHIIFSNRSCAPLQNVEVVEAPKHLFESSRPSHNVSQRSVHYEL